MKKIISLFLSIIMLLSALMTNATVYAAGWSSNAKSMEYNTTYTECWIGNVMQYDYLAYRFNVPTRGKVSLNVESENLYYISSWYSNEFTSYYIYKSTDLDSYYIRWNYNNEDDYGYSSGRGVYYEDYSTSLPAGDYYLVIRYAFDIYADEVSGDTCDYILSYSPTISKPSTLKVSSRKTTSLGLTWSKVGDVDGYQLQRKSGDTWKTITNTTSNSYTVSSLKSGTKYDFRVRSYIDVDGTKYYSSWKSLSTPTKPSTPSIKAPSTNKKHQIIVKWNKVSAGTGYQVQFSKKKNFSSVIATKTVSGISKTSYTGKNFTKNKTYYVRVRAYKTVDGTKYYGSWSKVKSVKCK